MSDSVADGVTSDGRLFQVFAAATQNARLPTVSVLYSIRMGTLKKNFRKRITF